MEISEAKVEEIQEKSAEARKLDAQAAALGELSRIFPEKDADMDPFIVLPRLITMHESGALVTALGSEESAQELIRSLKKACDGLTVVKLRRKRKVHIVLAVLAVLGLIWFVS